MGGWVDLPTYLGDSVIRGLGARTVHELEVICIDIPLLQTFPGGLESVVVVRVHWVGG